MVEADDITHLILLLNNLEPTDIVGGVRCIYLA